MDNIKNNGIYFISGIKDVIQSVGGEYRDTKERPVVALLQSEEHPEIYWAIPIGDLLHRKEADIKRIEKYLAFPQQDIRSNFYHIGNTNIRSIFFISDVFPITSDYISREYLTYNAQHYVIKNQGLITELNEKLKRILAYELSRVKKSDKYYFRQNIFGIYNKLVELHITDMKTIT